MNKLYLFDCDETLWTSPGKDYISRGDPPLLQLVNVGVVKRVSDGALFTLRPNAIELFSALNKRGDTIGIVSDNLPRTVWQALELFKLTPFITEAAVNIQLWDGYCPKHKMVAAIMAKPQFNAITPKNVYWFDDKDYATEAKSIGVHFMHVKTGLS